MRRCQRGALELEHQVVEAAAVPVLAWFEPSSQSNRDAQAFRGRAWNNRPVIGAFFAAPAPFQSSSARTPLLIIGVIAIAVGVAFVVLRNAIARFNVWGQNQTWGTHWGDRARGINSAAQVIGGGIFIVVGIGLIVTGLTR
jgi:hypothetical protein